MIELTFKNEGVPVFFTSIPGIGESIRTIIDSGAPVTTILTPENQKGFEDRSTKQCTIKLNSMIWEDFPLSIRLNKHVENPLLLIGMDILKEFCISLNFERSLMRLQKNSKLPPNINGANLTFFRSRPIVSIPHWGEASRFVLDTGSSTNRLFIPGQVTQIMQASKAAPISTTWTANGLINKVEVRTIDSFNFLGKIFKNVPFNISKQGEFGGDEYAVEEGIIGPGALAQIHKGWQVIDFINKKYYFI